MENLTVRKKIYSDGSKSWFLDLWENEMELLYSLRITAKQFGQLKKQGIEEFNKNIDEVLKEAGL